VQEQEATRSSDAAGGFFFGSPLRPLRMQRMPQISQKLT
jgi:hypothetical protein